MISKNLFSLKGKTALVTGGSTGIGFMATAGLVSAGAKVFIVSRKLENCQNAAKKLNNCKCSLGSTLLFLTKHLV